MPRSSSSAFSFSSSTTARRTVHTLIGSYVAFRRSTRPPIAVRDGDVPGPYRWCSEGDTDPTGSGGTVLSISGVSLAGRGPNVGSLSCCCETQLLQLRDSCRAHVRVRTARARQRSHRRQG